MIEPKLAIVKEGLLEFKRVQYSREDALHLWLWLVNSLCSKNCEPWNGVGIENKRPLTGTLSGFFRIGFITDTNRINLDKKRPDTWMMLTV